MSQEDADRELMANIDKRIKKEFKEISGTDLHVTHCAANGMYRIRVPKAIRAKYELSRDQYYSKTEKGVLQALYNDMFGEKRPRTLAEVCEEWIQERASDPDISPVTKRHDREYLDKYVFSDPISLRAINSITVQEWNEFFKTLTTGRKMLKSSFINVKSSLNLMGD